MQVPRVLVQRELCPPKANVTIEHEPKNTPSQAES